MISNILAATGDTGRSITSPAGMTLFIIYLFFLVLFVVLVISLLIRLVRFLSGTGKEMKLMRMELGKLAEEVHLIRAKLEGEEKQ